MEDILKKYSGKQPAEEVKEVKEEFKGECEECVFVRKQYGSHPYCMKCGIMKEYDSFMEDIYDLPVKSTFRRNFFMDREVVKYLERSELGTAVQQLAEKNGKNIPNTGMILYYANQAIQEVNKYRTQFKVKGKTPLKMVALIVITLSSNTCITKDEVLTFFGLQGKNLNHTQSLLNDFRQQFMTFNCDKLIENDVLKEINDMNIGGHKDLKLSEFGNFLKSSST